MTLNLANQNECTRSDHSSWLYEYLQKGGFIVNPVSLEDLANFLYQLINAYEGYLFMAFTLMMASSVLVLSRNLLVGRNT